MKKFLSVILSIAIILCISPRYSVSAKDSTKLRFNKDGTFKILVLADCQDDKIPEPDMMTAINGYLDITQPDLVVFTGDNVLENTVEEFTRGVTSLLEPVISRNIPYAFTFGNHDDEYGVSKEEQLKIYQSLGTCLTTDPVPSLSGLGTCNIPILSSTDDSMAFNLWIVDSNTYDTTNGGYDRVHTDQLNWLKTKQAEITKSEGKVVNSIVFQHIIVPEVTRCLKQSSSGTWNYCGTRYKVEFNNKASGTLLSSPSPTKINGGEYDVIEDMGGVLGIVSGHDHLNNFIAHPGSVDLIQVGAMTYRSFCDDRVRGASLITLNEDDTGTYKIQRYLNEKLFAGEYGEFETDCVYTQIEDGKTYISEVAIGYDKTSADKAKAKLTKKGYTVIDYDLNNGVTGNRIYLGYKKTKNVNNAITALRVFSSTAANHPETKQFTGITFNLASSVNLNSNAGGNYIYLYYTKKPDAGAPITKLAVTEKAYASGYIAAYSFGGAAADLNKNAGKTTVYLQTKSSTKKLQVNEFFTAYENAAKISTNRKTAKTVKPLTDAIGDSQSLYIELKNYCRTTVSQDEIDKKTDALTAASKTAGCSHICHMTGIMNILWNVLNFFNKLLKINQYCTCGEAHW